MLTTPSEKRLFMSYYTRQGLFANRILCFDDVLTDFYNWIPAVHKLWLLCLVFEPNHLQTEELRNCLVTLWRVYVACYPTWRARQKKYNQQTKQWYRAGKRGVCDASHQDVTEFPDVDTKLYLEQAKERLGPTVRKVFEFITSNDWDPSLTPPQIASKLGITVDEVDHHVSRWPAY